MTKTARQHPNETKNKFPFISAQITPTTKAAIPEYTEDVAEKIAGTVITESVTYGT